MDQGMRRVVSEPDDMADMMVVDDATAGSEQSSLADHSPQGMVRQPHRSNDFLGAASSLSNPPNAPFTMIENHHHHRDGNYDSSSSLSDDEDDDPDDDVPLLHFPATGNNNNMATTTTTTTAPTHHGTPKLPRTNSRSSSSSSQMAPSSQNSSRDWGWFEDVHMSDRKLSSKHDRKGDNSNRKKTKIPNTMMEDNESSAMAVTAPNYVLEESLSSQRLWKESAGQRPPQPAEERAFFEKMWAQNFERSQVAYNMPVEVLTSPSPISIDPFCDHDHNYATMEKTEETTLVNRMYEPTQANAQEVRQQVRTDDGNVTVLVKGENVFGTMVSKSFQSEQGAMSTITVNIASFRVVESKKEGRYAQFLVIFREGSMQNTVGVWKRYRDFEELAQKVMQAHEGCGAALANISPLAITDEPEHEHLPNAITSWRLVKKRQRWYRCLDAGYLSLKVFLLERFLHDIAFESTSPKLLRDFVGQNIMGE